MLENLICLFIIENTKEIAYPKSHGTPNPPNHINYYAFWIGCQECHFGELDLFVYHLKYKRNCISKKPRDTAAPPPPPPPPQTALITIRLGLVAKIIIWENWICVFTIENARGIAYPKGPGTTGPINHINYFILKMCCQDNKLGELNLFIYQ